MNEYRYSESGHTFKRVSKTTARKAYNNGLRVILCPCKLRPGSPWYCEVNISGKAPATFEAQVNAFEYYNLNRETGRYTAFYIPVRTVDRFTGEAPTAETLGTVEEYDYSYLQ